MFYASCGATNIDLHSWSEGSGFKSCCWLKKMYSVWQYVNWDQSQDWSLIDIEATCQPLEAEPTKAGLNETSRKYRQRNIPRKMWHISPPPVSPVLVSMCVEIPVQNIILCYPFFKKIYSKKQCMHSHAYATFAVMWVGNVHDVYNFALPKPIIMWWTVRVHNEAWSDLKIYLKCDEKKKVILQNLDIKNSLSQYFYVFYLF